MNKQIKIGSRIKIIHAYGYPESDNLRGKVTGFVGDNIYGTWGDFPLKQGDLVEIK